MTFELQILVWTVLVLFATLMVQGALTPLNQGFAWGLGARDEPRELSVLQGRLKRAVGNSVEALVMFAPLVIAAAIAGVSNGTTQLGAMLFLASRIAFPVCYALGTPYLRTLIWTPGTLGIMMTAYALLTA
ncbi:MAG: MAPEG family protein [Pseudomonadota bacterium]